MARAGLRDLEALGKSDLSGPSSKVLYIHMLDNITIYVCKSMVTCCCCVHAAVPAAYSMLLYSENAFVINVGLYYFAVVAIVFIAFRLLLFCRVD